MSATIRTDRGTFTGRTIQSVLRREYGRDAGIDWETPAYRGEEVTRGLITCPDPHNPGARIVLGQLLRADGDVEVPASDLDLLLDDLGGETAQIAELDELASAARDRRDELIRRALRARVPYERLGEITGLSRAALDSIRKGQRRRQ